MGWHGRHPSRSRRTPGRVTGRVSIEAAASGPVALCSGLVLLAQPAAEGTSRLPLTSNLKSVQQLDRTLSEIAERFGAARSEWS